MDKPRPVLAVVLCVGIFLLYTYIFPPAKGPQNIPQKKSESQSTLTQSETHPTESLNGINEHPAPSDSGVALEESEISSMSQNIKRDETLLLENDAISAQVSLERGAIVSWKLKDYHQETDTQSPLMNLVDEKDHSVALALSLDDSGYESKPLFQPVRSQVRSNQEVQLQWTSDKMKVFQTIKMSDENPYLVDVTLEYTNNSQDVLRLDPKLWIAKQQKPAKKSEGYFSFLKGPSNVFHPMYYVNNKLETKENIAKLPEETVEKGLVYWSGLTDRYFLLSLIARQGNSLTTTRYGKELDDILYSNLSYGKISIRKGETITQHYTAYLGPKKREQMKSLGVFLEKSVNYGWLTFVAIPLLWLLVFFEKIVLNWGVAIIILTFLVKLLLHPINKKSMQSMKEMQKLQPKLKELKEKYKDNKEKLNQEMMGLFRSHKVNPMGGCLPMVLQMPVYFALYKVLWNSIELYHAPFFWVYNDLSAPDPFMVTPILLGVMMALQQKLTPQATTMEPAQQKVMMLMPLMFAGFMIFFPFGLVLYILVNTVMTVLQQYMIHRDLSFIDLLKKLRPSS